MNPAPLFNPGELAGLPESSSSIMLLQHALELFRRDRDADGIAFCLLARERLAPEQAKIAEALDAFLLSCTRFRQVEQSFHEAGRRFVEAEAEWLHSRLSIEALLPAPQEGPVLSPPASDCPPSLEKQDGPLAPQMTVSSAAFQEDQPYPVETSLAGSKSSGLPALTITVFGSFSIWRRGQPIVLCQNRNGQAILRYLVAQPNKRASTDTLMCLLWPEDEPATARHKVQVAVSALRHSLNHGLTCPPSGGYVIYEQGNYLINPSVAITSDIEQFMALYQHGRQSEGEAAIAQYEQACLLYSGPFLVEDLYADWSFARREQIGRCFLVMCRALTEHYLGRGQYERAEQWGRTIVHENRCDEEAHCQLIRIYMAQGRRSEAIRQYQACERILGEELGVLPMTETRELLYGLLLNDHANCDRAEIERR